MPTHEREFTRPDGVRVKVRRSTRRTRTVSAAWRDGTAVVSVPARLPAAEEAAWVESMLQRLLAKDARTPSGDAALMARATQLSERYLEGRARPASVRWVRNQQRRWGSASAGDRSIRLSHRLEHMPDWVVDAVLVHELAHLIADDGHGPRFRALENRYPRRAEAFAFLNGVSWATDRALPAPGAEADAGADDVAGGDCPEA